MIDNRKVHDNHQEGIGRVKMRKGDLKEGQGGKMHSSAPEKAHWMRSDSDMTPRKG
jgi:hypothetical protein